MEGEALVSEVARLNEVLGGTGPREGLHKAFLFWQLLQTNIFPAEEEAE